MKKQVIVQQTSNIITHPSTYWGSTKYWGQTNHPILFCRSLLV